jgi:16S rRNA processing protein RimM
VAIGHVARAHGIRGAVRVALAHAGSDTLEEAKTVYLGDAAYTVRSARRCGDAPAYLVELAEVTDRDAADALRGAEVSVARELVAMDEGEFLVSDLVGCAVFDPAGRAVGVVRELFWNGAQDVVVLDTEQMFPLVDEWLLEVDLEGRRIVVETHDAF